MVFERARGRSYVSDGMSLLLQDRVSLASEVAPRSGTAIVMGAERLILR